MSKASKIVIGIDQSYQDTGVTMAVDGDVKFSKDIYTKNLKNNSEKRKVLKDKLESIFKYAVYKRELYECDLIVIIERIRLQSQGFLNMDYIKSIGALNALIVDLAYTYQIPVFSVDTRSWKSNVIGTSKPMPNDYGLPEEKFPTIVWCIKHGYKKYIINYDVGKRKNGIIEKNGKRYTYNDNTADSIGICLYGFCSKQKLEREN